MGLATEQMAPDKNRLSLLVVEDNPEYAINAREAFRKHDVLIATSLEDALGMLRSKKIDLIISDVHFPSRRGEEPKENISTLMHDSLERGIPIVFITKADHHGLVEDEREVKNGSYFAIRSLPLPRLEQSICILAKQEAEKTTAGLSSFSRLFPAHFETVRGASKTSAMWVQALQMLRNDCAKATLKPSTMRGHMVSLEVQNRALKILK